MKSLSLLTLFLLLLLINTILSDQLQEDISDEQVIQQLQQELQSLDPHFIDHFIDFYHRKSENNQKRILNITRVSKKDSTYLLLVGKMYLYKFLPSSQRPQLRHYDTKSNYMAAYYYLRVAAQHYQNKEAYYLLGILQQFKLVPDKLLEINIDSLPNKNANQNILLKYLQQSHLYNAQSMLFMSSGLGFHPASLSLGYMNRNRLGTSKNCTTALAYYLSVIKQTYVQSYLFRQVYHLSDSLQDELYSRNKLAFTKNEAQNHFIEDTQYFDQEIIQATIYLADSYYMGSGGHLRNLTRAARLYQKLANGGSNHGKVMAGICYFKGQGVQVDRKKAKQYFLQTKTDQISDYMLLAIKYYEILEPGTKDRALAAMLEKYKSSKSNKKQRLGSHMNYLIGSVILKGELKQKGKDGKQTLVPEAEGYQLLDTAAAQGNTMAKVLLGVLFSDGAVGLKYGCDEATKYFSQQAMTFPFFMNRASAAQFALSRGWLQFSFIKYMELAIVGYQNAYTNIIYLLEVYGPQVLNMKNESWSIHQFKKNAIYKQLQKYGLIQIESFILQFYSIKGKPVLNFNNFQKFLKTDQKAVEQYHSYIRKKIIRWGSIFDSKNILKYYQYKLAQEQKGNSLPILSSLASGDSSKLYVSEARYLLGKYHHHKALQNKTSLTPNEHFRILGQYNRAVKSQIFGRIIFHIEEYLLGKQLSFSFFQSDIGEDLLAFIFLVSIAIFILYYLRSKRIDIFHKAQLEKQIRKAAQEKQQERLAKEKEERQKLAELQQSNNSNGKLKQESQIDPNQPIISQDNQKGVRIGSSFENQVVQ